MPTALDDTIFLTDLANYITSQLDDHDIGGFAYTGILPPISTRQDYLHFPPNLFPFVGVAPVMEDFADQSLGAYYPMYRIQVLFSNRESGSDPQSLMTDLLGMSTQMKNILISTIKGNRFDQPNIIQAATLVNLNFFPTFYAEVDGDRKAFNIAYFNLNLNLGGI